MSECVGGAELATTNIKGAGHLQVGVQIIDCIALTIYVQMLWRLYNQYRTPTSSTSCACSNNSSTILVAKLSIAKMQKMCVQCLR